MRRSGNAAAFLQYPSPGDSNNQTAGEPRPGNVHFVRLPFYYRPAQPRPPFPRCGGLPAEPHMRISPLRLPFSRDTPSALAADAAMARARRRSRTPEGRTERRSRREHHPAHGAGKVRADAPRDTRRTGYSPMKETPFALPQKGEYGGAGGVEGSSPLTPCPTPGRRPTAHAGQQPQFREEQ